MKTPLNVGGKSAFPKRNLSIDQRMAEYDALPKPIRDVLKYSFISLDMPGWPASDWCPAFAVEDMHRHILSKQAQSTLDTYGPEHPEANQ